MTKSELINSASCSALVLSKDLLPGAWFRSRFDTLREIPAGAETVAGGGCGKWWKVAER